MLFCLQPYLHRKPSNFSAKIFFLSLPVFGPKIDYFFGEDFFFGLHLFLDRKGVTRRTPAPGAIIHSNATVPRQSFFETFTTVDWKTIYS